MLLLFLNTVRVELTYQTVNLLFGWRKGNAPSIVFWLVIIALTVLYSIWGIR